MKGYLERSHLILASGCARAAGGASIVSRMDIIAILLNTGVEQAIQLQVVSRQLSACSA